tara:strand:- start:167 stop:907 length:741 start_codon:yes stop_codon:yes gene_type:complete
MKNTKHIISILTILAIVIFYLFYRSEMEKLPPVLPKKNTISQTEVQDCNTFSTWFDINVCLPDLEGMTECYDEPKYIDLVHYLVPSSNPTLAYYMNDSTYIANVESTSITSSVDDYFWVYATDGIRGINCTNQELNYMDELYIEDYPESNWNNVRRHLETTTGFSVDVPILLEKYSIYRNIKSYLHLIKFNRNGDTFYMVYTVNLLLIKNRIIWAAYYKEYEDESSLNETKTKNNSLVLKLFEKNN